MTNIKDLYIIEASKEVTTNKRIVVEAYSTIDKPVARVRAICQDNLGAKRKELVAICQEAGVNLNTAKTQVQKFLKKLKGPSIYFGPQLELDFTKEVQRSFNF